VSDANSMNAHPTREEDFDLYALGALDAPEMQQFESHLATCSACATRLAAAQARVALLAFSAAPVEPSAAVKQRLMQRIHSEGAQQRTVSESSYEAPRDLATRGIWKHWWAILVPAAAGLALATLFLWVQNRRLDHDLATLRAATEQQQDQLLEQEQSQEQLREQLQDSRAVADLMASSDTMVIPLASMPKMPKGTGRVVYSAKMGMLFYDGVLEAPPQHKSYQLWLVPKDGSPINAGVFNPVGGQDVHWMMKLPKGIDPKAFAVTLEPAGGKPQPTGPKVLVGAAS
jgi:anti-sigma-K factor RskA